MAILTEAGDGLQCVFATEIVHLVAVVVFGSAVENTLVNFFVSAICQLMDSVFMLVVDLSKCGGFRIEGLD